MPQLLTLKHSGELPVLPSKGAGFLHSPPHTLAFFLPLLGTSLPSPHRVFTFMFSPPETFSSAFLAFCSLSPLQSLSHQNRSVYTPVLHCTAPGSLLLFSSFSHSQSASPYQQPSTAGTQAEVPCSELSARGKKDRKETVAPVFSKVNFIYR